jgi:hypothetical protein
MEPEENWGPGLAIIHRPKPALYRISSIDQPLLNVCLSEARAGTTCGDLPLLRFHSSFAMQSNSLLRMGPTHDAHRIVWLRRHLGALFNPLECCTLSSLLFEGVGVGIGSASCSVYVRVSHQGVRSGGCRITTDLCSASSRPYRSSAMPADTTILFRSVVADTFRPEVITPAVRDCAGAPFCARSSAPQRSLVQ